MSKFIWLNLVLVILFFNMTNYCSKLMEAIDTLNLEKIGKLLKKTQITRQEKDKILVYLSILIEDCKKPTKSIFDSKTDLTRLVLGLLCAGQVGIPLTSLGFGLTTVGFGVQVNANDISERNGGLIMCVLGIPIMGSGIGALWLGINQIKKGIHLYSAYDRLKRARKIETLIENSEVKIN